MLAKSINVYESFRCFQTNRSTRKKDEVDAAVTNHGDKKNKCLKLSVQAVVRCL